MAMTPPPRQTLSLWSTTMGVCRWDQAEAANPLLMRVFGARRATQSAQRGAAASAPFFAGDDDLQQPPIGIAPRPGQLIVFPSWLPHQALPHEGRDHWPIVSFNASVHAHEQH